MSFNLARFDLVSLRLVVLCAQTGSLSAAAKRSHCSVSAASLRLSALERAIGRRLFDRGHRGLQLTEAGTLLVRHGMQILGSLEELSGKLASVPSAAPAVANASAGAGSA